MKYYKVKPFRIGMIEKDLNIKESEQYVIIDLISSEDLLYCDDNCFLITPKLLLDLKNNNLTGVNVLKPKNMKFSIQHNMKHPNKRMRDWYRLIPFRYDQTKQQEIFLDHNDNLIVNERIFQLFKKHRIIRANYIEHHLDEDNAYEEEVAEKPVFKAQTNNNYKEIIIFIIIMFTIAYMFFK
ncbi:hypothetical protein [Enterobacter asburiae]|nr:hypothetical protein [Salmonella enterica]EJG8857861.1 hypothetical protein [Salmonella enterica]